MSPIFSCSLRTCKSLWPQCKPLSFLAGFSYTTTLSFCVKLMSKSHISLCTLHQSRKNIYLHKKILLVFLQSDYLVFCEILEFFDCFTFRKFSNQKYFLKGATELGFRARAGTIYAQELSCRSDPAFRKELRTITKVLSVVQ